MKKRRAISVLLLLTIIITGVCGCGMKSMKNEKSNVIPYLEEKYGEAFTLDSYIMRSIDIPYDEAICVNARGQKLKVYVDYEDESVVMTDNYYGTLKMPQYRETLQELLQVFSCDYKVCTNFTASFFEPEFNKDTPILEAMAQKKMQFYSNTVMFVPEDAVIEEAMVTQLQDACKEKNMAMNFRVYKMDAQTYATIDETQMGSDYIRFEDGVKPLYDVIIK